MQDMVICINEFFKINIDGLVLVNSNSIANALGLLQSYAKPSIYYLPYTRTPFALPNRINIPVI